MGLEIYQRRAKSRRVGGKLANTKGGRLSGIASFAHWRIAIDDGAHLNQQHHLNNRARVAEGQGKKAGEDGGSLWPMASWQTLIVKISQLAVA